MLFLDSSKIAFSLGMNVSPVPIRKLRSEGETEGLTDSGILSNSFGLKTETEDPVSIKASDSTLKTVIGMYRPFRNAFTLFLGGLGLSIGICFKAGA